jgi:hypothetical protein
MAPENFSLKVNKRRSSYQKRHENIPPNFEIRFATKIHTPIPQSTGRSTFQ